MTAPLRLLQITDTHLPARSGATLLGVDTAATLERVLDQALAEHEPDAVIASGDLVHDPDSSRGYERFRDLLTSRFRGPIMYLPGNHDLADPFDSILGGADTLQLDRWTVIGFDTHVDREPQARFEAADRVHLETRIGAAEADFVLLACHHPPLPVGCGWLDKDRIPAGAELLESCAAAGRRDAQTTSRVRGLVFGHVHQQVDASWGALPVLGAPSTCFQFPAGSQRFAIDTDAVTGRPGYRWLSLLADGSLRTEVCRLADRNLNIDLSDRD